MRMKEPYEAYFDDYDILSVYMSKSFFNGSSRIFHLKDTKERIIPLTIQHRSDLYNGDTHYKLSIDSTLDIGEEYTLYDEHCKRVVCQYSHIVKTKHFNDDYFYDKDDLGCTYTPKKTTFKLWSPVAYRIQVCLEKDGIRDIYRMVRKPRGIFEVTIPKNLAGYRYTFMVRVNGKWHETIDPYSSFCGQNAMYSVVVDPQTIHFPRHVKLKPMEHQTDAIIYEASIRDMTSQAGIGVKHPKTFVGFTEENEKTLAKNTGFTYLKSLGITHVQLLPVFDFGSMDEMYPDIFYNWGYDPVGHRCLEGAYSTNCEDAVCRIEEFAKLVQDCHMAGLRVTLDLVFNHVYEKENYPLEKLVPNYYFLMNREGEFSNGSFCGNDIDTLQIMSHKYFVDTCKRIVEWFDVDGFRFDLMGILDIDLLNDIVAQCRKIKPDFMIYGEGWNMPSFLAPDIRASQQNQHKMNVVGHFNDFFRENIRGSNGELERKGYANGNLEFIEAAKHCLCGCVDLGYYDSFEKSINYVECHDNHTLWDKNRVCCREEGREIREKRQVMANAFVLLAQGIPFLHAGQEFGRTKQGIGNSYNRSDNYNRMDYSRRDQHITVVNDTKKLIKIRKEHESFRLFDREDLGNISFDTIESSVLIYYTNRNLDRCGVVFNPTERYFNYGLNSDVHILFDNGMCNAPITNCLLIAPYSVIVFNFSNS